MGLAGSICMTQIITLFLLRQNPFAAQFYALAGQMRPA